jgi:multidrug efflux pump subunit AcrA (membrane-fusion protein)
MKKLTYIIALISALISLSSCAETQIEAQAPPELLKPVAIREATAKVERGTVEDVDQYRGMVRVKSDKLSFGDTGFMFKEYHVLTGQRVKEGDLLVTLNTEAVDKQIEAQQKYISRLLEDHAYDNEASELDIAMAQTELAGLIKAAQSYDEAAMDAVEVKKIDIEKKRVSLAQQYERQALTLKYAEEELNLMLDRVKEAELRAPYDGVITYMADKFPGDWVEPFSGIVYISDESELFVEYALLTSVSVQRGAIIKGVIGTHEYDLERIPLTPVESAYYTVLRLTPPLRFTVLDPDENYKVGAFVTIYIYNAIVEDTLRIPVNSFYYDIENGQYVYVVKDGKKEMRQVETGLRAAAYVEIKSGLEEGETVFVKP